MLLELNNLIIPETLPLFHTVTRNDSTWKQQFNPKPGHYRSHGYLPNFTIVRVRSRYNDGWFVQRVVIQASAPKALYGSNYFSIGLNDYKDLVEKLAKDARLVEIPLDATQIEKAALRNVAFCFNFFLPSNFPYPIEYLKKMSFLDIGKRYKKAKNTNFIEETEGYSGKLFNSRVGFGFYDKRSQMINEAKTPIELELVDKMKRGIIPSKILRLEVTYQNRTSVKQHLSTRLGGGTTQERHLVDVFRSGLAKGILFEVFDELSKDVNVKALEMPIISIEEGLKVAKESGMSNAEAEMLVGRSYIIQQVGSGCYKKIQDRFFPRQRRYELEKRYKKLLEKCPLPQFALGKVFSECRKQLDEFKLIKPSDLSSEKVGDFGQLALMSAPPTTLHHQH